MGLERAECSAQPERLRCFEASMVKSGRGQRWPTPSKNEGREIKCPSWSSVLNYSRTEGGKWRCVEIRMSSS